MFLLMLNRINRYHSVCDKENLIVQRTITGIQLFCEAPSGHSDEIAFETTGPPSDFFQSADDALGFGGSLVRWISEMDTPDKQYISRVDDHSVKSFFAGRAESGRWDVYFASNDMGIRYSLLVEFSEAG